MDVPGLLSFPIPISSPALPISLHSFIGNPFIVPPVSVPIMFPVVSSPTRVYVKIEAWNTVIVNPTPVIVM